MAAKIKDVRGIASVPADEEGSDVRDGDGDGDPQNHSASSAVTPSSAAGDDDYHSSSRSTHLSGSVADSAVDLRNPFLVDSPSPSRPPADASSSKPKVSTLKTRFEATPHHSSASASSTARVLPIKSPRRTASSGVVISSSSSSDAVVAKDASDGESDYFDDVGEMESLKGCMFMLLSILMCHYVKNLSALLYFMSSSSDLCFHLDVLLSSHPFTEFCPLFSDPQRYQGHHRSSHNQVFERNLV